MRVVVFVILLTAVSGISAQEITSVMPPYGPASGGTLVTLKGEAFDQCPVTCIDTRFLLVDGVRVDRSSWVVVDDDELRFVTPPHAPGTVTIEFHSYVAVLSASFTYVDDAKVPAASKWTLSVLAVVLAAVGVGVVARST